MKKHNIFILFVFFFLIRNQLHAQTKYLDNVFDDIKKETHTYFSKPNEDLKVDIYFSQKDSTAHKPVLLYVHGGGFAGGQRDSERNHQFCMAMAKKGYVTATMSYTLVMKGQSFGCDQPAPNKIKTFRLAGQDISRAVRYMIQHRSEWSIDTSAIVIAGSSAGAEAVLHAAFWDKTREDSSGYILFQDFRYAGVISMAGAIISQDLINSTSAIPVQLFHGTCDNLVPYGSAPHHYCPADQPGYLMLHGAKSIADKLLELGEPYYLYTACNGGHEWASKPLTQNINEITDFLYLDVLNKHKRQIHIVNEKDNKPCPEHFNAFIFCNND